MKPYPIEQEVSKCKLQMLNELKGGRTGRMKPFAANMKSTERIEGLKHKLLSERSVQCQLTHEHFEKCRKV